ncbi:MAG: hypothetical protein H7246_06500 [Phycisphaerae bacterium]|nr:hypothetical protein [Saprospiraceae bacterium]
MNRTQKNGLIVALVAIDAIVIASKILNAGWLLVLFGLPILIHLAFHTVVSIRALNRIAAFPDTPRFWTVLLITCNASLLTGYMLLPDFGDIPVYTVFFGLIQVDGSFRDLPSFVSGLLISMPFLIGVSFLLSLVLAFIGFRKK